MAGYGVKTYSWRHHVYDPEHRDYHWDAPDPGELQAEDADRARQQRIDDEQRAKGIYVPDVWDRDDIRAVEAATGGRVTMTRQHVMRVDRPCTGITSLDVERYEPALIDGTLWVRVRQEYLDSPTHPSVPPF